MRRWNTNEGPHWRRVAAALALAGAALVAMTTLPGTGRAEHAVSAAPTFSRAALDRLGDFIRREIAADKIPGGILLIQQHGKPVYFESFGVRDPATRAPMTPDTIFQVYSMTKAVTSVAAMMLVEEGKLSLDDPVSKYIPAFADIKVGIDDSDEAGQPALRLVPPKHPITIKDLLRHTSGIIYGFYNEGIVQKLYARPELYQGDFDNAEFAARL
jgi:CubicO group peptidase (beta-lactamase class C family)